MSKFLAIPLLLLGMGLMPMAAYSGMGKRIQEAASQAVEFVINSNYYLISNFI